MTADPTLTLGWLVLAHLVADFLLQTESMVNGKFAGRWRPLLLHGAAVALCLVPFAAAFDAPGLGLLAIVAVSHVAIDRWKIRATRHAEAEALAAAHRRHDATGATAGLGPAWTPVPGALFVLDQVAHLAVAGAAWAILIGNRGPNATFVGAVDRIVGAADRGAVHAVALVAVVIVALAIANIRAAALFVATLVTPRQVIGGDAAQDAPPVAASAPAPHSWRLKVGSVVATAEPLPVEQTPETLAAAASRRSPARIGATIGILERILIVILVLAGSTAAIGFVVAAKTLARFRQLDDRDFAEYYLLGTLASVAFALATALVAAAAIATLRLT
ncbi:MAG TPA: DUF3307 domain-containing protein [Candidatus Limnocylindrales bacterium]